MRGVRYPCAGFVVGALAVAVGGCSSGAAQTATADAQVESGNCHSAGSSGHVTSQSCDFVLSDGQQFRCHKAFAGQTPTARMLEHANGCVRLRSLRLSPAVRAVVAAIDKARSCLTARGLHPIGGPVLPPNPPGSSSADGELVVGKTAIMRKAAPGAFIAFYTDAAKARRLQAELMRNARRLGGQIERYEAVTVLWLHRPASGLSAAVHTCANP